MSAERPEIPLPPGTCFVGDLHLQPDDEAADGPIAELGAWLGALAEARTPRLVILGDLFEYWIGPAQLEGPGARAVVAALAELRAAGTAIDLVPGNRDFLLDATFERASGAVLRPNGCVGIAEGSGERTLVIHGDELCTLDVGYQRLRRVLRARPTGWLAARLPAPVVRRIARRLRRASKSAVERKPSSTVAQQESECRELARRERCGTVICGHAHTFRDERLAGGPRWIVVDAFGGDRDVLAVAAGGALEPRSTRGELDRVDG